MDSSLPGPVTPSAGAEDRLPADEIAERSLE